MPDDTRSKRGFAAVDPELRRALARKGGQSAHAQGKAHRFTSDEAAAAGRKGALARSKKQAEPVAAE